MDNCYNNIGRTGRNIHPYCKNQVISLLDNVTARNQAYVAFHSKEELSLPTVSSGNIRQQNEDSPYYGLEYAKTPDESTCIPSNRSNVSSPLDWVNVSHNNNGQYSFPATENVGETQHWLAGEAASFYNDIGNHSNEVARQQVLEEYLQFKRQLREKLANTYRSTIEKFKVIHGISIDDEEDLLFQHNLNLHHTSFVSQPHVDGEKDSGYKDLYKATVDKKHWSQFFKSKKQFGHESSARTPIMGNTESGSETYLSPAASHIAAKLSHLHMNPVEKADNVDTNGTSGRIVSAASATDEPYLN